jgi:hypothetical protein
MSFTKSYNLTSDSLKGELIFGIGANNPTRIDLARRSLSYSDARGDYYIPIDSSTEETLYNRLDSIKSKFTNVFRKNSFRVVDLEPGERLVRTWSETPEGSAYWTSIWKSAITGIKFDLSESLGDTVDGNHTIYLGPIKRLIAQEIEALRIPGEDATNVSTMEKIVFSFYSTDFPTRGESPITAITTVKDNVTVEWKLRDSSKYSLMMVKGVIYPIEPHAIIKLSEGGAITLFS